MIECIAKDEFSDGLGCTYVQMHRLLVGEDLQQILFLGEYAVDVPLERLGLRSAMERMAVIFEQANAVMALQKLDVLCDAGLRHVQRLRSFSVIHLLVQGDECVNAMIEHGKPHKCT